MTYLAATLYINKLYQEQSPMIVLAEGGSTFDNILSGITEYAGKKWDEIKERPFAGLAAFLGGPLLMRLGFPWMGIAYEVAGALGFDWAGIWESLKNSVWEIIRDTIHPSAAKPTKEELQSKIEKATDDALSQHVSNTVDEEKLQEAYDKAKNNPSQDKLPPSTGASSITSMIKRSGVLGMAAGTSRGILSKLFRKIIPFAITTAIAGIGLTTAAGAARGAIGITTDPKKDDGEASSAPMGRQPIYDLTVSPSVDRDLYKFNSNGPKTVWLERGNIGNIRSYLIQWIESAFPDLKNEENKITSSKNFIQVEKMFKDRNLLAESLDIYSFPKPFERKIDIVSYIINGYLKDKPKN
jgi:hypothetical protein